MTTQDWLDYHFLACEGMRKEKLQAALRMEALGEVREAYRLHDESARWRDASREVDRLMAEWMQPWAAQYVGEVMK